MAIFMKFGDITGDVETSGFEKWTELQSFQWGVGRGVGSAMSGGNSREGSIPSVSEITVTKRMDGSSPGLWTDGVAGELGDRRLDDPLPRRRHAVQLFRAGAAQMAAGRSQ